MHQRRSRPSKVGLDEKAPRLARAAVGDNGAGAGPAGEKCGGAGATARAAYPFPLLEGSRWWYDPFRVNGPPSTGEDVPHEPGRSLQKVGRRLTNCAVLERSRAARRAPHRAHGA